MAHPWRALITALVVAGCAAAPLIKPGIYYRGDVTIVVVRPEDVQRLCSGAFGCLHEAAFFAGAGSPQAGP